MTYPVRINPRIEMLTKRKQPQKSH